MFSMISPLLAVATHTHTHPAHTPLLWRVIQLHEQMGGLGGCRGKGGTKDYAMARALPAVLTVPHIMHVAFSYIYLHAPEDMDVYFSSSKINTEGS